MLVRHLGNLGLKLGLRRTDGPLQAALGRTAPGNSTVVLIDGPLLFLLSLAVLILPVLGSMGYIFNLNENVEDYF